MIMKLNQFNLKSLNHAYTVLDHHPTTSLMVRIIPSERRHIFALTYSYFRWLDDQIDDGDLEPIQEEELFKRAYSILEKCEPPNPSRPEQGLLAVLEYSDRYNLPFQMPIGQMTRAIELDSKRVGQIPTKKELLLLRELRVYAYLNALRLCTKESLLQKPIPSYGVACDEIHIMRDFKKDFNDGIFNFSVEDVQKFSLDINDIKHPNWQKWFTEKHNESGKWLRDGYSELRRKPSRYHLMCIFNLSRYASLWVRTRRIQ